ncbi:MAG TPA: LLM class flavin-dependent oxidoreductase [Solirubrobacteraceae bacterium]|jgi:alkanesulfonate monooxygenase SsuD/methylene tetrahydromethanopterin reductase-like flavin-dependent oxidoreductase (luciferase family)|nr:LLM class flavin-dependent oxidoreductase [Solirubrobacteraceae bacterium]
MHIGTGVFFQGGHGPSDAEVWRDGVALADRVEPLGFDSLWTAEHHFDDYVMSPSPTQFLTYMAGRTSRVKLGSMVMVVPWHDPVRLAEEISVLDELSDGRLIAGFGRGLGIIEFDGFRLNMGESRRRFVEHTEAILQGLETGEITYEGELYRQPTVQIRPRVSRTFRGRVYASAVSPASSEIMARLGIGLLIIAQKPWETTFAEISRYRERYLEINGTEPPRPVLANFTSIHSDPERALELREAYGVEYARSAVRHYDFGNPRIAEIPGYEYYAALRQNMDRHGPEVFARFLAELQIFGTPEQVVEETLERVRKLDAGAVINVFDMGGTPADVAIRSMELYAREVLPRLQAEDTFRDVGYEPSPATV